jgi:hypothetical protein
MHSSPYKYIHSISIEGKVTTCNASYKFYPALVFLKKKIDAPKTMPSQNKPNEKGNEYGKMCDADVCVGIRIRETGQVYILSADTSGFWAFLTSPLVCYRTFY